MEAMLKGRIQNLLRQKPCEGAKTDSRAKFGKETVAGAHRRPKWVPHYGAQADSGRAQDTQGSAQALLRLCSGSAQALLGLCSGLLRLCSGSAQACSGLLRLAQACSGLLRLCSGMFTLGSGMLTLSSG
jgi:hypothetical protein